MMNRGLKQGPSRRPRMPIKTAVGIRVFGKGSVAEYENENRAGSIAGSSHHSCDVIIGGRFLRLQNAVHSVDRERLQKSRIYGAHNRNATTLAARLPETPVALIFTAPPRETPDEGKKIYQPIAEFLSKALGKKVVYQHPETWGLYRTKMLNGSYDLIFDDPHFASYRVENLNYTILVKLPEQNELAVFVSNQTAARDVRHMAGRTFCTHAPPDLGALVLLSQFDNPARQPVIVDTKGWEQIYNGVIAGKCDGGVMPLPNLKKFDRANLTRIIYITMAMPNQAVSSGPHVLPDDQTKIVRALLAPEADASTAGLRAAYKAGNRFVPASNQEYRGLAKFLRNEWGYY